MLSIPAQFAMIYDFIFDTLLKEDRNIFYNITLVTVIKGGHANKYTSIQSWFWRLFGFQFPNIINHISDNMDITLVRAPGWCVRATHTYFSPLVISPQFLPTTEKARLIPSWKLYWARYTMYPIKHFMSNLQTKQTYLLYFGRGSRKTRKRSVVNDNVVIAFLKQWAKDMNLKFDVFKNAFHDQNRNKEKVSSALVIVGPHGGMFANMNFAQPGTYFVEFVDFWMHMKMKITNKKLHEKMRPSYYELSQANGLFYHYLKPKNFHWDTGHMYINITKLRMIMYDIEQKINANNDK